MGNLSALWEEHKKFVLGVGGAAVVMALVFFLFIRPASEAAEAQASKAKKEKRKLAALFQGPAEEHPTQALKREYQKRQGALRAREEELLREVCYTAEAPFLLPQGETQPDVYFTTIHDRTREEVRNAADLHAIELSDLDLGFDKMPGKKEAADALAVLSMVRTACLAAVEAGVSRISRILLRTGRERSVQMHDRRLEERILQMEVQGHPDAVLRLLRRLQRRGAFLLVVGCEVTRLKDDDRVKGVVDFAALSVRTIEEAEGYGEEEDGGGSGGRRW